MKAKDLVEKLDAVSPALSSHGLLPILTHYWFTGEEVLTYNETIGMSIPCKTDFKGAVPSHLLKLLKASNPNGEVIFDLGKNDLDIVIGKTKGTFQYLPIEDALETFTMPDAPPWDDGVPALKMVIFRIALESCLQSISNDTANPELRGVVLIPKKDHVLLFSSSGSAFTKAELSMVPGSLKSRIAIPREFCIEFLNLTKSLSEEEAKNIHLEINKKYVLAEVQGTRLYSQLIAVEKPYDFEEVLTRHFTEDAQDALVDIPEGFQSLVARSMVVTDADVDQEKSELSVADGKLRYLSNTKRGIIDDLIPFDHADIDGVKVHSKHLNTGLDFYTKIALTERCVIMVKAKRVYMIATT